MSTTTGEPASTPATSTPSDSTSTPTSSTTTPSGSASKPQDATSKPKRRPFPSITGGCLCNTVRYRLLNSPLFCYACHCLECQRLTGSAFSLSVNIEMYYVSLLSPTAPILVTQTRRPGVVSRHYECPACHVELWSNNVLGSAVADVRVGTLDFPSLMEPDVHSYVGSKLDWFVLPPGARSVPASYEIRDLWPESSLRRLDVCQERFARKAAAAAAREGEAGDGEKTPTASGEYVDGGEDDEAFEKRYRETEKALQERLEKLTRKLEEEDKAETGLEEATGKLNIGGGHGEKIKDGLVAEPVD